MQHFFEITGVGYKANTNPQGFILYLKLGFSHEIWLQVMSAQSSNSQVGKKTRDLIAKATSSILCTHQTKPFRGFLRDRFTLCRFTKRRNLWTFGDHVFHMIYRYSCQHSHFWYFQVLSSITFFNLQSVSLLTLEKLVKIA